VLSRGKAVRGREIAWEGLNRKMAGMMCFRECLGWRGLMRGMAGWVERRAEMVWTFGLLRQRVLWCRMAGTGAKRAEAALSCGSFGRMAGRGWML